MKTHIHPSAHCLWRRRCHTRQLGVSEAQPQVRITTTPRPERAPQRGTGFQPVIPSGTGFQPVGLRSTGFQPVNPASSHPAARGSHKRPRLLPPAALARLGLELLHDLCAHGFVGAPDGWRPLGAPVFENGDGVLSARPPQCLGARVNQRDQFSGRARADVSPVFSDFPHPRSQTPPAAPFPVNACNPCYAS